MTTLEANRVRGRLRDFDFRSLFIEELGWDRHAQTLPITIQDQTFSLTAVAHKRLLVAFVCAPAANGRIPDYPVRRKIETEVAKTVREHLIIYIDADRTTQVWQWVRREPGKPLASREQTYHRGQSGEALVQKMNALQFGLEEEESLTIVDVTSRVRAGFDLERVTKRFYDRFKTEHDAFLTFLKGIPDDELQRWYASVMLNRLMFIYFIQKKRFLDGDPDYLRNRLKRSKATDADRFYADFLCPLFFEGFAKRESERTAETNRLLGRVPYLNGGLFQRHQIEELHGKAIQVSDAAFERLFDFFDDYQWHLDERPLRNDNEINPDVLGYIFEKYINQKQMGAYYTKEDITEYISKNTVVPYLFDAARPECRIAFEGEQSLWRLLQTNPDRYFYDAVKKGVEHPLPPEIAAGLDDVSKRSGWNKPAAEEYALPTEIWREVVARRKRYEEVWTKLANGEVRDINDLITYNLNIIQFAQDVIENSEGPELIRAFYHHAIEKVTVLDPTCGSGAFLFAALNILEPLYEACLERMQAFLDDLERSGEKHSPERFSDFRRILKRIDEHPNRRYFILKSIIVNNLYGVDIMEEAVEICKLRLFLKLVAQVERAEDIEPLPDIDFNIRAGNTLVGFATRDAVKEAMTTDAKQQMKLLSTEDVETMARIDESAEIADRAFRKFHEMQTEHGMDAADFSKAKEDLRSRQKALEEELNRALARQYGIDPNNVPKKGEYERRYSQWLAGHKPFHWFIDFYGIMNSGGFDVIIGNPPYLELKALTNYRLPNYRCIEAGNLYAVVIERCIALSSASGRDGFIVPVSSVSTDRYESLQELLSKRNLHFASFDDRPSRLFDGLEHIRLTIHLIAEVANSPNRFSTRYNKWMAIERPDLFQTLRYAPASQYVVDGSFPKLSDNVENGVIHKLLRKRESLSSYYRANGKCRVFYSRKVGYFLQVLDFQPTVLDGQGRIRPPSEFKELRFVDAIQAKAALCCLNSNLFYWFVTVFSDCRHVNKREVDAFPIELDTLTVNGMGSQLAASAKALMDDLRKNSENRRLKFRHDTLTVQTILPKLSKPIIDEIDRLLANHYGFTDEEVDFIINYDIKYRMGRESGEDDGE